MSLLRPEIDFRTGMPDARLFPYASWRALLADQLRPRRVGDGSHIDAAGVPELRAAIARHIGLARGVAADPKDVFVTNGSQQAIDLVCRLLVEPGETVVVEDPGYPPVCRALAAHGARVVGVPVDEQGLRVDLLPAKARLVYVTPSHQFPLGGVLSRERRLALLEWAERADAVVVEDDYDSEFRFGDVPLHPLYQLDGGGRVLYTGSFSKVMLPVLRLGFLVAPAPLHRALRAARHCLDWHTEAPGQAALAEFVDRGWFARHVRRMRGVYGPRRDALAAGLREGFAGELELLPSVAGLHLSTAFGPRASGRDDRALMDRMIERGVAVQPVSAFARESARRGLLFGYGAADVDAVRTGLGRLRELLDEDR